MRLPAIASTQPLAMDCRLTLTLAPFQAHQMRLQKQSPTPSPPPIRLVQRYRYSSHHRRGSSGHHAHRQHRLLRLPTDDLVTEASLTLSGSAEVGASIQLLRSGTAITSATTDADTNGDWSITFDLTEGENLITATASDTAGNVSAASAAVSCYAGHHRTGSTGYYHSCCNTTKLNSNHHNTIHCYWHR